MAYGAWHMLDGSLSIAQGVSDHAYVMKDQERGSMGTLFPTHTHCVHTAQRPSIHTPHPNLPHPAGPRSRRCTFCACRSWRARCAWSTCCWWTLTSSCSRCEAVLCIDQCGARWALRGCGSGRPGGYTCVDAYIGEGLRRVSRDVESRGGGEHSWIGQARVCGPRLCGRSARRQSRCTAARSRLTAWLGRPLLQMLDAIWTDRECERSGIAQQQGQGQVSIWDQETSQAKRLARACGNSVGLHYRSPLC
eukprot:6822-Chlamydomonas_euryale.AAC.1